MLGISEEEFLRMQREMYFDKKFMANLEAAAAAVHLLVEMLVVD
jgi:hypothetical protein